MMHLYTWQAGTRLIGFGCRSPRRRPLLSRADQSLELAKERSRRLFGWRSPERTCGLQCPRQTCVMCRLGVCIGSGHVIRQSFGERRQWGGSYGPRFCSVCPLPRMWRPEADSRLPASLFRFAPVPAACGMWVASRKQTLGRHTRSTGMCQ